MAGFLDGPFLEVKDGYENTVDANDDNDDVNDFFCFMLQLRLVPTDDDDDNGGGNDKDDEDDTRR